jgi:hypothetical protein
MEEGIGLLILFLVLALVIWKTDRDINKMNRDRGEAMLMNIKFRHELALENEREKQFWDNYKTLTPEEQRIALAQHIEKNK